MHIYFITAITIIMAMARLELRLFLFNLVEYIFRLIFFDLQYFGKIFMVLHCYFARDIVSQKFKRF